MISQNSIKRAIKALQWINQQKWAFDANMYDKVGYDTVANKNASKERRLNLKAIEELERMLDGS